MQNEKQKIKFTRCEKYSKYGYNDSSSAETNDELQYLQKEGYFCDIQLETDDKKIIPAHKAVLESASQFFYEKFNNCSEMNYDTVVMRGIDSTALELLVNFFYSGDIVVTGENVQILLPAANILQLREVKEACCEFLQSQLGPTNCISIYDIADLHSCTKLLTSSELCIQQHFSEVVRGNEFLSLSSEKVIRFISSDKIKVLSQEKVFECVIRWVKHELDSRICILSQLKEHVRLPFTSMNDILKRVVLEEPLIKNCLKRNDYISEALHFHRLESGELIQQNVWYKPRQADKVILVFGGFITKLYDPKMNQWQNGPKMARHHKYPGLAVVKDNLVFAVGGSTHDFKPLRSVDVLDLSSESPCWKPSADMLVERQIFGVGVINNNIYAVGGHNYSNPELATAEVFDYNTQEWRMVSSMSTKRSDPGVGVLNNILYAVGGFDISSWQVLDTVECYDPSLDTWTPVAKLSVGRRGAGVAVLDGVLYAVGGKNGSNILKSVEAYRPSTGVWTTVADMNLPRKHAGVVALDGLLYVIGGIKVGSSEDSTECYSPKTDTWTKVSASKNFEIRTSGGVAINRPRHIKTF